MGFHVYFFRWSMNVNEADKFIIEIIIIINVVRTKNGVRVRISFKCVKTVYFCLYRKTNDCDSVSHDMIVVSRSTAKQTLSTTRYKQMENFMRNGEKESS